MGPLPFSFSLADTIAFCYAGGVHLCLRCARFCSVLFWANTQLIVSAGVGSPNSGSCYKVLHLQWTFKVFNWCFLNIRACQLFQVTTQIKSMNLKYEHKRSYSHKGDWRELGGWQLEQWMLFFGSARVTSLALMSPNNLRSLDAESTHLVTYYIMLCFSFCDPFQRMNQSCLFVTKESKEPPQMECLCCSHRHCSSTPVHHMDRVHGSGRDTPHHRPSGGRQLLIILSRYFN